MAIEVLLQAGRCFSGGVKTSGGNGIFVSAVDADPADRGHADAFSYFERTYLHSLISSCGARHLVSRLILFLRKRRDLNSRVFSEKYPRCGEIPDLP